MIFIYSFLIVTKKLLIYINLRDVSANFKIKKIVRVIFSNPTISLILPYTFVKYFGGYILLVHKVIKMNNENKREERIITNFHYFLNGSKRMHTHNSDCKRKKGIIYSHHSLT